LVLLQLCRHTKTEEVNAAKQIKRKAGDNDRLTLQSSHCNELQRMLESNTVVSSICYQAGRCQISTIL